MTFPIRNSRVRTPHGTLFWREVGRGPTVLMLHGSWTDSHQWLPLMSQLGSRYHCVAPDLLGFGESSKLPSKAYSIKTEVACLNDYLTHIRIAPQVILADSLGAWVAIRYCLQYPSSVRQLVLLAPEGLTPPALDQRWQTCRWLANAWAPRYWTVRGLAPLIRMLGGDRWLQKIKHQRRQLRSRAAACRLLFQRRKAVLQAEGLNEDLPLLETPVTLLQPNLVSAEVNLIHQRVQSLLPHAYLHVLPGNDSTIWETATDEIQAIIQSGTLQAVIS